MSEMNRRSLLTTGIAFICAPAIVRITSLMPVKAIAAGMTGGNTFIDPRTYADAILNSVKGYCDADALYAEPRMIRILSPEGESRTLVVNRAPEFHV